MVAVLAACTLARIRSRMLFLIVSVSLVGFSLFESMQLVHRMNQPDTRTLAGDWIRSNIPAGVPVLLFGPPEAEPQVRETAASIQRRIGYVYNLYGAVSGAIVSEPYRLLLQSLANDGRDVYRNPGRSQIDAPSALLVLPEYPGGLAAYDPKLAAALTGEVLASIVIPSLDPQYTEWDLDRIDAFYLPFRPLGGVIRPGPGLRLEWRSLQPTHAKSSP